MQHRSSLLSDRSKRRDSIMTPRVSIGGIYIKGVDGKEHESRPDELFKVALDQAKHDSSSDINSHRDESFLYEVDRHDHKWRPFKSKRKRKRKCTRGDFQLDLAKEELVECCLTHKRDTYKVHMNRVRGIEVVNIIVDKARVEDVKASMAVHVIWACLSCVHYFLLRLRTTGRGPIHWVRRRRVKRAMQTYEKVLRFLMLGSDMYQVILNGIVSFFEESNLWQVEYLCTNLLKRLFYLTDQHGNSLMRILILAENDSVINVQGARQIIFVVFEIQRETNWAFLNQNFIAKLLEMYYCSATPNLPHIYQYPYLRPILDLCIRSMCDHMDSSENSYVYNFFLKNAIREEIPADNLMEFGVLLDHVGHNFRTTCEDATLTFGFLPDIIALIGSKDLLYSLLGHRLLHQLFDIRENRAKLIDPVIFFMEVDFKLQIGKYNKEMKNLYKLFRESIQTTFISAVLTHGSQKIMLMHTFLSIALLVIEVPCAYTAAAAVCIAVALQDHALHEPYDIKVCHSIHATVLSILSLVAYIHKAESFYEYIISIMEKRAKYAPHLNPPLRSVYKYAQHHVLWNDPGLFFEHFNCRYGLMKCFVTDRRRHKK